MSVPRLVLAIVVVGALAFFGVRAVTASTGTTAPPAQPWFAPYVDVTLTPTYQFQDAAANPARTVVLSFVVATPTSACTPSWGAVDTLGGAATSLDLDRRIEQVRERGNDVAVSFGGAANTELANACSSQGALTLAYASVVQRYQLRTVDLDLEGAALSDAAAMQRRALAMATLQADAQHTGRDLGVWLTLPVTPAGLTPDGVRALDTMLAAHVQLSGVNALVQNFGGSRVKGQSMISASEDALTATQQQVEAAYRRVGTALSSRGAWQKIGATPMIGQNNVRGDVFTFSDAQQLLAFRTQHGLARLSFWSLNRDTPCGPNVSGDDAVLLCTGLADGPLSFTHLFAALPGRPARPVSFGATGTARVPSDNPATSPYPIWSPTAGYPTGTKVVWHGNVYAAKYFTQDDYPDAPVAHTYQTPWQLVGPVLSGEKPETLTTLPPGTYPTWVPSTAYQEGARVLFDGVGYQARYFSQGAVPSDALSDPGNSPWALISP